MKMEYMIRRLPAEERDILREWEFFLNEQAELGWKMVQFVPGTVVSPGFVIFEAEAYET